MPKSPTLALICDEIRDPGNLGSLLRSAAAAGVQAVALTRGCADAWGLKALRSGMGAQFRVPITSDMEWSQIRAYCDATKMNIKVAEGSSKLSYTQIDWRAPSALVIGSEAQGPSVEAFKAAHHKISIPMSDHVESLNAAMAGAVILFEAKRQREMTVS